MGTFLGNRIRFKKKERRRKFLYAPPDRSSPRGSTSARLLHVFGVHLLIIPLNFNFVTFNS